MSPFDPMTYGVTALVLVSISLLAAVLPARRAPGPTRLTPFKPTDTPSPHIINRHASAAERRPGAGRCGWRAGPGWLRAARKSPWAVPFAGVYYGFGPAWTSSTTTMVPFFVDACRIRFAG